MPSNDVEPVYLAVDLGASSGRVYAIQFGDKFQLDILHRFDNKAQRTDAGLCWDYDFLWQQILVGLSNGATNYGDRIASVGVDTWGVDYVLLDQHQQILGPSFCYRDDRNVGVMEQAFERLPRAEIFFETGIQFMQINSLYQLMAHCTKHDSLTDQAKSFLMVPDYLHWKLSGSMTNEVTNASTTQILQPRTQTWSNEIIEAMDFRAEWFLPPTQPGTNLGIVTEEVAKVTGLQDVSVIAPASHDTASAVLAIPKAAFAQSRPTWGYISSGTWSLMGVELDQPILTQRCLDLNFTNEAGPQGSIRLLKNIAGLWPLQQVQAEIHADQRPSWKILADQAAVCGTMHRNINLDDARLINPQSMTAMIHLMLIEAGHALPVSLAQLARIILESLADRYRVCLVALESLLGYELEEIFVIGGGVQNGLLCRLTADATKKKVIVGHSESTAIGNALMQAVGTGHFASILDARTYAAAHFQTK